MSNTDNSVDNPFTPLVDKTKELLLAHLESKKAYHKCDEGWFEYVPLSVIREMLGGES